MSDKLPESFQLGLAIFLTVMLVVGVIGNILTIYVIVARQKMRTTFNVFVANLAVSDIVLLLVNLPTNIWEFFHGGHATYDKAYCKYTSPINIMTMICSLTSVAAVGLNRYLLLCVNKSTYNKCSSKFSLTISVLVVWLWSFLITTPPMFGFGEFGYHEKFHTCFFKAYDEKSWLYGTIFCCVLGVFPPVLASTFFYGKILLKLRDNKQNLMRHYKTPSKSVAPVEQDFISDDSSSNAIEQTTPTRPTSSHLSNKRHSTTTNALLLKKNAHQRKSILMLVTVFVIIVICWLPISVSFILDKKNRLPSLVYVCFVVLAWLNSCINIFIYTGMNQQFRNAYKDILPKCTKKPRFNLGNSSSALADTTDCQLKK